jgi:hypothetical protein
MEWGPILAVLQGPLVALLTILISKWWDARVARIKAQAAGGIAASKSDAETAREFYAAVLRRADAIQDRCDKLNADLDARDVTILAKDRENVDLRDAIRQERAARSVADDLCKLHNEHLDELYVAGQGRWGAEWGAFLGNLHTTRPRRVRRKQGDGT